jgi:hypothetical protein
MLPKTVVPAAVALALLAAAPASADSPLYLQGSGVVQGARFQNFVVASPGQPPRGWLTVTGAYSLHATATCANVTDGAATLGYRNDSLGGAGWVVSVKYPDGTGNGGGIVYAGNLPSPPTTCPAPGGPPPDGFRPVGAGALSEGAFSRTTTPPAGPTSIVSTYPPDGTSLLSFRGGTPFFADLNGDDARGVTLTISRAGGSKAAFTAPMTFGAGGLEAVAQVPVLDPGSYTATYTLERADGSTTSTTSGFEVRGPRRIRDHNELTCRRLPTGRHACTVGLKFAESGRGPFRIRRGGKVVAKGRIHIHNGSGQVPGVKHLPPGRYVLELDNVAGKVFAKLPFRLR